MADPVIPPTTATTTATTTPVAPARLQIEVSGQQSEKKPAVDPTHPAQQPGAARIKELCDARDVAVAATAAQLVTNEGLLKRIRAMEQDHVMGLAAGQSPNLAHPDVQRFFRGGYEAYAAETGEKAMEFSVWLASESVASSPLYAAHLVALTPEQIAAQAATVAPVAVATADSVAVPGVPATVAAPPPNPNVGVRPVGAADPQWTDVNIARARVKAGGRLVGKEALEIAISRGYDVSGLKGVKK